MGRGEARIALYGPASADAVTAGTVEWDGDDDAIVHVPSVYFDKILLNLARMPREQERLLENFEEFVESVYDELAAQRGEPLDARVGVVPLVDDPPPGKPLAVIRVVIALAYEKERAMAATDFKPLRAMNETVAELGLWALWDWIVLYVDGHQGALAPILENLRIQCRYYREHGAPGMRDIGKAPFYAMMKGSGDRLAGEIGAIHRLTGAEFRALPSEERDGLIAEHTRRPIAGLDEIEEEDPLWAVRPAAEHLNAVYEALAEQDRAETEAQLRSGRLSHAKRLDLSGEQTSDDDLARFPEMPELKELDLARSRVTDAGLVHLKALRSLDVLDLSDTGVTGEGLAHLAAAPLTRLDLSGSKIGDDGLRHLAALKALEMLWLIGTRVTDAGLAHLLAVPSLKELDVSDTGVTDSGLERLIEHPNLFAAYSRRTRVTDDAVEAWLDADKVLTTESEEEEAQTQAEMDQQFADHLFEQTAERFHELYADESNPTIGGDLERALRRMVVALGYVLDPADPSSRQLWSLGSAGYVWRVGEDKGTGFAKDRTRKVVEASFDPENERYFALAVAAKACLEEGVPLGLESPGGLSYGRAFLDRALRHASDSFVEEHAAVSPEDRRAAFYFGVALHDVEPLVDELLTRR